jgi:ABC-type Fe3+/spermidine/putrescine transport system ATPase subunit
VRLEPAAGAASVNGANQLTGTVRDVSYIGVSTQYIVDTTAGDEIVVFAQNAGRITDQLRNGDGVRVLWEPEHTFVITDSGEVPSVEELV